MKEILQYKGYVASIQYSERDEVFYGKILGIDDLVSFEVVSEDELKDSFKDAVDDYLEACERIGKQA